MQIPGQRQDWLGRLKSGLTKTRSGLTSMFTGEKVDEAFFEEMEERLLLADCRMGAADDGLSLALAARVGQVGGRSGPGR